MGWDQEVLLIGGGIRRVIPHVTNDPSHPGYHPFYGLTIIRYRCVERVSVRSAHSAKPRFLSSVSNERGYKY